MIAGHVLAVIEKRVDDYFLNQSDQLQESIRSHNVECLECLEITDDQAT